MEFLEIALCLAALLVILFAPKLENWAFVALWAGWLLMMWLYVGHTSGNLFGLVNL